jgi:hypothetical protein
MPTKHYFVFNNFEPISQLNKEAWDSLRVGTENPAFQFEATLKEYESNCARRTDCREMAKAIRDAILSIGAGVSSVVSLGAGKGIVEWHLKKLLPSLPMICTDYAESGVASLRHLFPACDKVMVFDMLKGDYSVFGKDAVLLMHRVSTEFTPSEWMQIFRSCKSSGIQYILFIPTELASIRLKTMETLRHLARRVLRRRDTFCGWLYSRREFDMLISSQYIIEGFKKIGHSAIYKLTLL